MGKLIVETFIHFIVVSIKNKTKLWAYFETLSKPLSKLNENYKQSE